MKFDLFSNNDLVTVGFILCVLLALVIIMLSMLLFKKKHNIGSKVKDEKTACNHEVKKMELSIETPFEEFFIDQMDIPDYKTKFLVNAEITSRSGKTVSIRHKYHERILKITQRIGNNEITMFSYIDNVLKEHFDKYQNEIVDLYNKNNESIF